ncbi:MAG: Hsp20/alpha crystallin family protein [Ignavibacteriales bacterium]|nr:Hsp20/alpha crystallin family protein [Ignavibacteriales bacterium]
MTLVRWNPVVNFGNMHRELDKIFEQFRSDVQNEDVSKTLMPVVDIVERENEFSIKVEIPGVDKKDVKITIQNDVLTIRGEKKQEEEKKGENYYRTERSYGTFQRSFTLPSSVANEKIDASYDNGILTLTIPKLEEAKPKEIEVKLK